MQIGMRQVSAETVEWFSPACKGGGLTGAGSIRSWPVKVAVEDDVAVPGRICALRKTREAIRIAEDRLKREASRKSKGLQPDTLVFARYVILFTTFPEPDFPARDVLEWYRVRWQVELVFKRFKSLAQLGHLPKYDDESAKAWLYAGTPWMSRCGR